MFNTSRQKTFFFFNQEWRRIIQASAPATNNTMPNADRPTAGTNLTYVAPAYATSQVIYVPTVAHVPDPAFAAKLQAAGLAGYRGQPFPGQVIPASLFDPDAVAYLNSSILPRANTLGDKATTSEATPTTAWESIVRIDHSINDKWKILGHYLHDNQATGEADADLAWNWETYNTITSVESNPANSAAIKLTGELSSDVLIEASMNYDGNVINITNSPNVLHPTSGWANNNFFVNSGSNQYPGGQWGGNGIGAAMQTGYGAWHNAAQDYEPRVDLSVTRGKHAMKYGFSYNRYTKNQQLQADAAGDYQFGQNQTGTGNGGNAGDPFMSQLLGLATQYSQPQSMAIRHYVNQTPSAYVNDNWKTTPRLSLQLGLRYDALPHAWERNNDIENFYPSTYVNTPVIWSTAFAGAIDPTSPGVQTPPGFGGASYYLNGMARPGYNGIPRGHGNQRLRHDCSLASVFRMT